MAPPQTSASMPQIRARAGGAMVRYEERRTLRQRPTEVQRKFLETLRDLGPRDNALTAATRRATKRACQVRGWVEWRRTDGLPDHKAWHLTIAGQKALIPPLQASSARDPACKTGPLGSHLPM